MKQVVYVLTMFDRHETYNNGVYNVVFSSRWSAVKALAKWVREELNDGRVERDDLVVDSCDFIRTKDDRFSWTIDEREVDE